MNAFFNDPGDDFTMGTGLTPMMTNEATATDFTMSTGWELPGQTGMAPGPEGVLRHIMQLGPMETMDLGWESNQ